MLDVRPILFLFIIIFTKRGKRDKCIIRIAIIAAMPEIEAVFSLLLPPALLREHLQHTVWAAPYSTHKRCASLTHGVEEAVGS